MVYHCSNPTNYVNINDSKNVGNINLKLYAGRVVTPGMLEFNAGNGIHDVILTSIYNIQYQTQQDIK